MFLRKFYIKTIYKRIVKYKILNYLRSQKALSEELVEIYAYLKHNSCHTYPYNFVKKYSMKDIDIFKDESCGLRYVVSNGKRLYFKRNWSDAKIKRGFKNITLEQDPLSPHCYLTPQFNVNEDDHVLDVGCAEANFSLSVVDKVRHITLFEVDELWIEALKMTFKPWADKVTIINRFVSDHTDDQCITIDDFSKEHLITFIKADVEGAEEVVLNGAINFLNSSEHIKVAITTYHKQHHADTIYKMLTSAGLHCNFSKGYMILKNQGNLESPYLRRGLIYAQK